MVMYIEVLKEQFILTISTILKYTVIPFVIFPKKKRTFYHFSVEGT